MASEMSNAWALDAIEQLQSGSSAIVTPHGKSMEPIIHSGQTVVLRPMMAGVGIEEGSVVLVKVKGTVYLHLIRKMVSNRYTGFSYLIGNAHGHDNGWVKQDDIYGIADASRPDFDSVYGQIHHGIINDKSVSHPTYGVSDK